MSDITISELARRSGLRASALRFYEEKGLIASTGRRGLTRMFDPSTVERLSLISLGRASGFSLDELAVMLADEGGSAIDKGRLRAKAATLGERIEKLERMRNGLLHAADCTAPSLMACERFRKMMKVAGRGPAPPPRRFRAEAV